MPPLPHEWVLSPSRWYLQLVFKGFSKPLRSNWTYERHSEAAPPLRMPWQRGEDYQASVEIKPAHLASYFLEHRNPKTSKKSSVYPRVLRRCSGGLLGGQSWDFLFLRCSVSLSDIAWIGPKGASRTHGLCRAGPLSGGTMRVRACACVFTALPLE